MNIGLPLKIIVDTFMINLAWVLAYYLRFHAGLAAPLGIPDPLLYFRLIPFISVIWLASFYFTGFYDRSQKSRSAVREAIDITQSCVVATMAFIAFTYFYEEYRYSRINTLIFAACHPILLVTGRSFLRKAKRHYRRRYPAPKALFIGTSQRLEETFQLGSFSKADSTDTYGVVCLDPVKESFKAWLATKKIPLLPVPDNWTSFLVEQPIARAFITVSHDHPFLKEDVNHICTQIPEVKIMPDFGHLSGLSLGLEMQDGLPIINVHESPLRGSGTILKRLTDIVGSIALLLLLSPVMLLIGLLVKGTSRGPMLYRQERMGLDGSRFNCLKFRSMVTTAEKDGAMMARSGDTRTTWVGRILRRTSLDELPQLFNVFKGDMSLVGPRPERPVFVKEFRHKIPRYMLRHKVKAGITGWAQVNGWRGQTSIEKRIECDLFYIQNWSIWLDIKILFLTIEEVISGKNAY